MIVGGVAQGLSLILRVLARDRRVLLLAVEDPMRATSKSPCSAGRGADLFPVPADLFPVPVDGQGLDVAKLPPADAVLLTPAHQYPTGVVLSPARRAALMEWVRPSPLSIHQAPVQRLGPELTEMTTTGGARR